MKKLIVGSGFKMRKSVGESISYTKEVSNFIKKNMDSINFIEVFILASFEALYPMSRIIKDSKVLKIGAQNCWHEDSGPYTGEVSPKNLKEIGCTYVEIGHPERRIIFKENSELINKKIKACIRNNLKPILFIGEDKSYKDKKQVYNILENQLSSELNGLNIAEISNVVLAYEPIWAIGAEKAADVDYIEDSLIFIRTFFKKRFGINESKQQDIFYGGSVTLDNALELLNIKGNDGISSGRGAMDPKYFIEMIKLAVEMVKSKK